MTGNDMDDHANTTGERGGRLSASARVEAFSDGVLAIAITYLATHERLLARQTPASFFARKRRRALLGLIAYLLAAAVALWQPLASLVIICALPVFYDATSEGWSGTWNRHREGSWS